MTCASVAVSLALAVMGAGFSSTEAQATLSCSFDASQSPIGTTLSGDMRLGSLVGCYYGYPGSDYGFTGFATNDTNTPDFSGTSTGVSSPPAVGFQSPGINNFQAYPTTLTSSDNHAEVTFTAPTNSPEFDTYQFKVVKTDGSSSAVFNFFCNGTNNDGVNYPINTPCTLTIQLPPPAAPTVTVMANPTTVATGATSTLTFTLTNPNSGAGLLGVADSITLPSNLTVAATPNASSTCGGTFSPAANATSLALTGGTLALSASCTFNVDVTPSTSGVKTIPTGTPSATGASTGTAGTSATLNVNAPLTTTQVLANVTLTDGSAASVTPVTAAGGVGTLSYALSGPTLPTGLSFSTTSGQITGTPTTTLTAMTFTVTATDQSTPTPATSAKTFSLTVNPALTTTQALATVTLTDGSAASFTPVTATGGTGTLSYALSGATLPTGLSFSTTTGQITGTPSTTLTATPFTVTVTDQTTPVAQTSAKNFSLTVNAALTTTLALATVTLTDGSAASFTPVTASGGTGTKSFALTGGTLPTGLSFNTGSGLISGTPSTSLAATPFTVTATDQSTPTPQTSFQTFSLTVNGALTATQALATVTLTDGSAASFTPVTAAGGTGTKSFALTGGTLPTGLSFNTGSGLISGTPSTTLTATPFTVTVTDQSTPTPQTSFQSFSLTVNPALTTTQAVATTTLTVGSAATSFTPVTAAGGTGTLSYALSGGTLPTGLNFSTTTGQITGTPTSALVTTVFTVTATDQTTPTAQTSSKTFSLTVNGPLTTTQAVPSTTLTDGSAVTPFTPVTATGGAGTLSYALSGGTLPTGLNFSTTTGQITGTPTSALAATTFTVTVTDQTTPTAQTSAKTFSLTVNAALATTQAVPSTTLTAGAAATPFTPVTAVGGTGTLSYALSGGTLPTGLSFSTSTGQITGTPTSALASTTFTVTVTDQTTPTAQTSLKMFSLTVNVTTLTTTQAVPSTTLSAGTPVTPFTPVTATGGTGTLSYALSGATLPAGLNFSTTTGQITGTPATALTTTIFTVTATDQTTPTAQTSAKTFSLTVSLPAFTFTPPAGALPNATAGAAYSQTVASSGGAAPYTYSVTAGALPAGLVLAASTGVISGTPTVSGSFGFTVTAHDAHAVTGTVVYSLTVAQRPDPSKDAEVIGVINAQAQAAQHFASTQITNFNDRLESLHDDDCRQNSFKLAMNDSRMPADTDPMRNTSAAGAVANIGTGNTQGSSQGSSQGKTSWNNWAGNTTSNNAGPFGIALNNANTSGGDLKSSDAFAYNGNSDGNGRRGRITAKKPDNTDASPQNGCRDDANKRFAAWTGGYVNFGKLSSTGTTGIDYLSTGVSAGADYRFSSSFTAGFGFGFGNDKSSIGANGTTSNGASYDIAAYGSWHPTARTFVDALIGYGIMNFNSNRYITGSSGAFAEGLRSGHQIFGSVTSGYEFKSRGFLISPYGRISTSWSVLDAFTESGGGIMALQYGSQTVRSLTGGFGLRTAYDFKEAWGTFTPRLRIEYAHEFEGSSTASITYADLAGIGGTIYNLPLSPTGSDYITTGIGADLRFLCDWIVGLDYRTSFGQEKNAPQMVQLKLGRKF